MIDMIADRKGSPMGPKLLFVIARQRSGTNLLRNTLSIADGVTDIGEVAQDQNMSSPASFLAWIRRNRDEYPDYLLRKPSSVERVFKSYVNFLRENYADQKLLIIDIKLDQLGLFNSFQHYPLQRPKLFDLIRENNYAIIHLMRSNLVEAYLSNAVAARRNSWVVFQEENIPREKVTLNIKNIIPDLEERLEEMHKCRAWLASSGTTMLDVEYQNILNAEGQLSGEIIDWVHSNLDEDIVFPDDMIPPTKKLVKSYAATVENFDDVVETLEGTVFGSMVPGKEA